MTGLRRFVKRPTGSPAPGTHVPGTHVPGTPAAGRPTAGTAAAGRPAVGTPAVGTPAVGTPAVGTPAVGTPAAGLPAPLGGKRQDDPPGTERCELCQTVLDGRHGHLIDMDKRSIACACRACYLLFTHEGAAGGRYRAVPERIGRDQERPLAAADWNELQIPVTMAFFFHNSALGRVVAGYPSPGGVTECELDLEAWDRLAVAYPLLAELAPDTEAIFVHKDEVFLIPIDMCYSLVGELRLYWQGFDGGAEARAALETFLAGLRQRAVTLTREH